MVAHWLKRRADKPVLASGADVTSTVNSMLTAISKGGEESALQFAKDLDGFEGGVGDVLVDDAEFAAAERALPAETKRDIELAHRAIRAFADAQRKSIQDLRVEKDACWPGMEAGHKMVAVDCAGCYAPGGRFAHVASALMTVTTAKAAGVETVVVCSPPRRDTGRIHAAVLFAARLAGADHVLTLGGVQGLAAMAYGLFTGKPANTLVGPGNRYVVAAKQLLFGRVGIDLIAGPTEVCILADAAADPELVATDLVGQAEHGHDSPAVLVTTSRALAERVAALMPIKLSELQRDEPQSAAPVAWRDHGEIAVVTSREEMCELSDEIASEHLQVQCRADELEWYHQRLRNYGSLFLGEETNVSFGDKASGPNHVLPTRFAGKYTGGLNVGSFLKRLSFQRITEPVAARELALVTARLSRLEGMEGHARSADVRLRKWLPRAEFDRLKLHPPAGVSATNTEPGRQSRL